MKNIHSFATRIFVATLLTSSILISCNKDDEPSGPSSALGKQFNLAVDNVTSSLAYSLLVSPDGSKILATMGSNNTGFYYSSDGGTTFNQVGVNDFLPRFLDIDNQGNILTDDDRIYNNGTFINGFSTFDELILGDNGKVFSYNSSSGAIKYADAGTPGNFTEIAPPTGPGGVVMKAPGIGILFLYVNDGAGEVKAYTLNESTLLWTDPVTFNVTFSDLNKCTGLNNFTKYGYAGNNIVTVKGCTGVALLDLSTSGITTVNFPDVEDLVYEDVRDGKMFVDTKKQLYFTARLYTDLTKKIFYRYDGSTWETPADFLAMDNSVSVFNSDQVGNIYFNSSDGAGESLKGTVKFNVETSTKTGLSLPTTSLTVVDAAGVGDDHLLIVVDGQLYDYDLTAHTASAMGLNSISHVNVLSDGRFVAGGPDHVYLSTDGKSWTGTKSIFSSADPTKGQASVTKSRIINGKTVLVGVFQYYYDNLSLGVRQTKYDDIIVEVNGSASTKLNYQFPGDFLPSALGPDGTLYGAALFVNEFGTTSDRYELTQNVAPERLTTKGTSPDIVTDDGLQLAVMPAQGGGHFEIVSRKSNSEGWTSNNTPLPGDFTGTGVLRQSGDKLIYIHGSEIYLSGN